MLFKDLQEQLQLRQEDYKKDHFYDSPGREINGLRIITPHVKRNIFTNKDYWYFKWPSGDIPLPGGTLPRDLEVHDNAQDATAGYGRHSRSSAMGRVPKSRPNEPEFLMAGWLYSRVKMSMDKRDQFAKWVEENGDRKTGGFPFDFWLPYSKFKEYFNMRKYLRRQIDPTNHKTATQKAFVSKVADGSEKRRRDNIEMTTGNFRKTTPLAK